MNQSSCKNHTVKEKIVMFENGILNIPGIKGITESTSEFIPGGNATNDVSNHVEDTKVTIPGGLKEQPTKEAIHMTTAEYEANSKKLRDSFKEAVELLDTMQNVKIVEEDGDTVGKEDQLIEAALDEAFVNALENGPIFEAVERSDKDAVKKITSKIRDKVGDAVKNEGYDFRKCNVVARIIATAVPSAVARGVKATISTAGIGLGVSPVSAAVGAGVAAIATFWRTRLWQIIGICNIESGNVSALIKSLNDQCKDELGEYKILASKIPGNMVDLIKTKFKWKNTKKTYMLIVDKKLPAELKGSKEIKESVDSDGIALISEFEETEGVSPEFTENMQLLYKQYLSEFIESGEAGIPATINEFMNAFNETYGENASAQIDTLVEKVKNKDGKKVCSKVADCIKGKDKDCADGNSNVNENADLRNLYTSYLMGYAESGITEQPLSMAQFIEAVQSDVTVSMDDLYVEYLSQYAELKFDVAPYSFDQFVEAVSGVSENNELTEATRLAKEIHKKTESNTKNGELLRKLKDMLKLYDPDSTEYKIIMKKIEKVPNVSSDERRRIDNGSGKPSRKPGSIAALKKQLNAIGESVTHEDLISMFATMCESTSSN